MNIGPMLNLYPDSLGGTLDDVVDFLKTEEAEGAFSSCYILPSLYHTDLDRGFSVIDYSLNKMYASGETLEAIKKLGIELKLDFILNHASVLSKQFQDIIAKGEESEYKDFFINWNEFWKDCGEMTEQGYILPEEKYLKKMFFRKPGLPILMVRFPDGREIPYWNTFYQEVNYPEVNAPELMKAADLQYMQAEIIAQELSMGCPEGKKPADILQKIVLERKAGRLTKEQVITVWNYMEQHRYYLGQMDLNIQSPKVWEYYREVLKTLAGYGAKIVRLDAFAYAPKTPGERNFLNQPDTWELLDKIKQIAEPYGMELLPEIHESYSEKIYEKIAEQGYVTYDFFLPGLIIDALESGNGEHLAGWAQELIDKNIRTVNMLGCHDGIPLLDLKGILAEDRVQKLSDTIVSRGGYVKDLHGQKNIYYQVNATYFSALGEDERKMLLARALQIFMPGKPQIWYLDLFAGKNDYEAVKKAGPGGHKEINRTNLTTAQVCSGLSKPIVKQQLELLRFRNSCPAFSEESRIKVSSEGSRICFVWEHQGCTAQLRADLQDCSYVIEFCDQDRKRTLITEG